MQEYVERLFHCGFSAHMAYMICNDFIKNYGESALEEYVKEAEYMSRTGLYVD